MIWTRFTKFNCIWPFDDVIMIITFTVTPSELSAAMTTVSTVARPKNNYSCLELPANVSNRIVSPNGRPYYARQCIVYRTLWAWSIFIMVSAPYAFVFVRCAWRVTFRSTSKPKISAFLVAALVETIHTVGVSVFAFIVLPSADSAILVSQHHRWRKAHCCTSSWGAMDFSAVYFSFVKLAFSNVRGSLLL